MKALILIGGFGTRLRPFTCNTPKPMLPILNKPFLEYQLGLIKKFGIKEVIFCVSYMNECFKEYYKTGSHLGLKIHYAHEKIPLGTGGAVKNAAKYIDGTTLVFNGDIFTDLNIKNMYDRHKTKSSKLTIALVRVKDPTAFGLVETDKSGRIEKFLEKPSWDEVTCNTVNAGTYIVEPEMLDLIPEGHNYSLERGLFPKSLEQGLPMYGFAYSGYWLDIGSVEKYMAANFDILGGGTRFVVDGKKRGNFYVQGRAYIGKNITNTGRVLVGSGTKIMDWVQFNSMVSIGRNCVIGKGASLEKCVLLDNCRIGEGAKLTGCIIGKKTSVQANAVVSEGAALGDGSVVTKFSKI